MVLNKTDQMDASCLPSIPATFSILLLLLFPYSHQLVHFFLFCITCNHNGQVRIPDTARADGWMCHDATEAVVMKKGCYVKLSTAAIPMPTVSFPCTSLRSMGRKCVRLTVVSRYRSPPTTTKDASGTGKVKKPKESYVCTFSCVSFIFQRG